MIQGRIIRIFDVHTVALNVGANQGVEAGMRFGIYTPQEDIVDPETGAVLGNTRKRKAVVEATSVQPMFTIAVAPTRNVRVSAQIPITNPFQAATERRQDTLPVSPGETQPYETGTQIHVGDQVEQIVPN